MVAGRLDGTINFDEVRRVLNYDQHTGVFRWRVYMGKRAPKGGRAGTKKKVRGQIEIKINGLRYQASRLAWLWMTGRFPPHVIDHKDLNPSNNAWENLREATTGQNNANRRVQRDNACGFKGVSPQYGRKGKPTGKWRAQISVNGRSTYLGAFKTPAEAHRAYKIAAGQQFGLFARD